ncbi:MAG TPA: hypothetical protein VGX03_08120 [Candidatus Binatia bacterium]|jgi:hypothetical protein|nr:hypothetical protein [Candidatus Binatia bacterium]
MFSQQNVLARQGTGIIRMDLWVSRQQLAAMLAWCHKRFGSGDWSYHRHCEPLLGKGAVSPDSISNMQMMRGISVNACSRQLAGSAKKI